MVNFNSKYLKGVLIMKLSKKELNEIINNLDKGLTLCLPKSISFKQYQSIVNQINKARGV